MSTYQRADVDQVEALQHAIRRWHPKLLEADVRVDLLVAFGTTNEDGKIISPAIVHQGRPCLGSCRVVKIQQQVLGLGDVLITIDGDRWSDLDAGEQFALMDHELTHIDLVLETRAKARPAVALAGAPEGEQKVEPVVKLDGAGRPCIRMRPHDHEFGFFDAVAARHGRASQEVQQANAWADDAGQYYFREDAKPSAGAKKGRVL